MDVIFFNRVPQPGNELLMNLINDLTPVNKFKIFTTSVENIVLQYTASEIYSLAERVSELKDFSIYIAPIYYVNFTEQDLARPIYINMIRDPVDRVISWYNYIRTPHYMDIADTVGVDVLVPNAKDLKTNFASCFHNKEEECVYVEGTGFEGELDYKRQMINFCGYDESVCIPFNSLATLQRAKKNVEEEYAVIGILEDTNITLSVLEHYVPKYFQGVTSMYHEINKQNDRITKPKTTKPKIQKLKDMVRKQFQREIEFYEFCRQRLYKQYIALHVAQMK